MDDCMTLLSGQAMAQIITCRTLLRATNPLGLSELWRRAGQHVIIGEHEIVSFAMTLIFVRNHGKSMENVSVKMRFIFFGKRVQLAKLFASDRLWSARGLFIEILKLF